MTREEDAVDDEDECDEQLGKFKHADIYKMHTYRDAIDEARSAWVMYPGSEFGMYESRGQARLVRDVHTLASIVEGVGALPSRPGAEAYELRALASVLLADVKGVHISADI